MGPFYCIRKIVDGNEWAYTSSREMLPTTSNGPMLASREMLPITLNGNISREASMGPFEVVGNINYSDIRQGTNVTQHRFTSFYQFDPRVQLGFTALVGRPLGSSEPWLTRLQFDTIYLF
jgi:hypothetical protein